jgi:probable phosphomutase (TIGR03848 family)
MPAILLIRHGENEFVKKGRLAGRLPGVHLNQKGREQVQALADKLLGAPIKALYSSPLERTMETAEPIAQALELEVIPCQGLLEVDFGEWQGKTLKGLRRLKLWKTVQHSPATARFPGGESFAEAQFRACRALEQIASKYEEKDIVACVSHSDLIKLSVAYYLGLPLDLFQRLFIAPASFTVLALGPAGSFLVTLNYDLSFTFTKDDSGK